MVLDCLPLFTVVIEKYKGQCSPKILQKSKHFVNSNGHKIIHLNIYNSKAVV